MRFFSTGNRFWQLIFLITDIVLLGLLWLVLSLTVVGFGPASTALYYSIAKSIRRKRGRPFHEFFHALKQNWRNAMFAGLIVFVLMIGIMILDYDTLVVPLLNRTDVDGSKMFWAFFRLVALLTASMHIFPVLSRFQLPFHKAWVLSFMLTLRHLSKTLVMSLAFVVLYVVTIFFPALPFFVPGFFTFFQSFQEERILKQYILDAGIDISGEKDPWYME